MEGTKGQKYIISTFHAGINQDIDPEFMNPQSGQILYSEFLRLDDAVKGVLTALKGDDKHDATGQDILDTYVYLGGMFAMGRIITFWFDSEVAAKTYIVLDNDIVGMSADLPGCVNNEANLLDMDHNPETGEIFITDDARTPIILSIQDLWDSKALTTYKADYDPVLYELKLLNQAHQPKFASLDDVGAGVGLKVGSYSYGMRYGTFQGEYTPWGPQTPFIPVLDSYIQQYTGNVTNYILPGTRVYGGEASITPSRYGIQLLLRVENKAGFDFIELRRYANNAGAAIGYTPAAEILRVTIDKNGAAVDIRAQEVGYIAFQDTNANIWIAFDDSEVEFKASIKAAKTIRYFDGRIILGGITYESRELVDTDIFINTPNVSKLAYPIKKWLEKVGYTEPINQVKYKSHRLGERYGFGAQLRDDQGNILFTIPLKNNTDDFRNYKFPERREEVPASELAEMDDMVNMPAMAIASGGDLDGSVVNTQANGLEQVEIDTVTLTGGSGTANVTCDGLTKLATFDFDLSTTVMNFTSAWTAAYAAIDIQLSDAPVANIIFEGNSGKGAFGGATSVANVSGDLAGSNANTQAYIAPVNRIDTVTLTGTSGMAGILCDAVTRNAIFNGTLTQTATDFVTDHAAAYLTGGVVVTSNGVNIIFTAAVAGVDFTGATTITNVPDVAKTYEASHQDYYPAPRRDKYDATVRTKNIQKSATYAYAPMTPTGRDPGYAGNGRDYEGADTNLLNHVEATGDANPQGFGTNIWATGLRIGGIDTTKLPEWVKGFSIVRTPPAGRVVCQGIATYALTEQDPGTQTDAAVKAANKVWFYSPELDPVIGDKVGIYEEMKANPTNYEMQLIAPLGFFSEMYSGFGTDNLSGKVDLVTWAMMHRNNGSGNCLPSVMGGDATIGNGEGYVAFGRYRNTAGDIDQTTDHRWAISSAVDIDIEGKNGRSQYLELTVSEDGKDFYQNLTCDAGTATAAKSRLFHEPFYLINIVQVDKDIPLNQTDLYQEIGHYQKLSSTIGYGTGLLNQLYYLADERPEDCVASKSFVTYGFSELRYILVNGQKWIDVTKETSGSIDTWRAVLESTGYITINSILYYGIYNSQNRRNDAYVKFPYSLPTSGNPVAPADGDEVVIVYNNAVPLDIYLGDTVVGFSSFTPIDVQRADTFNNGTVDVESFFYLNAPMPYATYTFNLAYRQIYSAFESGVTVHISAEQKRAAYLRQWMIMFVCESTVNLPLVYKNFFPHKHYVMRPNGYDIIKEGESEAQYLDRIGIAAGYKDDYPGEYQYWDFGGLHFPQGSNFDYEKGIGIKAPGKPVSSETEVVNYPKRLVWTLQKPSNRSSSNALKSILPTNYYDLNHFKSEKITLLYDAYSSKGNNLYVVTDKAVGLLLTDKAIIRDFVGDALGIAAQEGNFIQAEQWLNDQVGCPDFMWRAKTEGRIVKENRPIDILVFPTIDNIAVLLDNSVITLKDGINTRMSALLNEYGTPQNDDREDLLTSFIHTKQNELWVNSQGTIHVYDFTHNAWTMEMSIPHYIKGFYAPWLTGYPGTDFTMIAWQTGDKYNRGVLEGNDYDTWDSMSQPDKELVFVVNPGLGNTYQFVDMFIKLGSGAVPDTAEFGIAYTLGGAITDPATVVTADFKSYGDGWYECKIPKTTGNKVVIGSKMFVRLVGTNLHEIKYVKTGYIPVVGG